tara:strand:- start:35 stop:556 length:522 start_codon:yes stop_codon:yes gene_type:complete
MSDWKIQLKEAYQVIRDKKKSQKPDTSTKFDSEINFKGRAGYNDTGIPLSPKTIKQKNKNKSMYAARARAKYWAAGSQLKNINDQRAAAAKAKYQQSADQGSKIQDPLDDYRVPYTPTPEPRYSQPATRNKVYNYYDPITFDDTVLVTPNKITREVKFKNKIEEAIWRLKNKG